MTINHNSIKKILIVNLKYIGDLIVATPVYETIRKNFIDSNISILLRKGYRDVIQGIEDIDEIIECDLKYLRNLSGLKKIKEEYKFLKFIRSKKFDLIICLHPSDRVVLWSFFSGAKYRVAPKKQSFSYLLNIPVDIEEESKSYLEYYLDMVRVINIPIDSTQTKFILDYNSGAWAENFILEHNLKNAPIIGIHPGASREEKRWDIGKYLDFISYLKKNTNFKVIVFQGPSEKEIVERISDELKDSIIIANCEGSVKNLGALIKYCRLVICNDSSARHIAYALKVKSITLFSREKYHCWNIYIEENGGYTIPGDICNECSDGICKGYKCLKGISVDRVVNKVKEILRDDSSILWSI
jgi:ADP-heptose:LPS heptosyltransferase